MIKVKAGGDVEFLKAWFASGDMPHDALMQSFLSFRELKKIELLLNLGVPMQSRWLPSVMTDPDVLPLVQLLLSRGADPNDPGDSNMYPLQWALNTENVMGVVDARLVSCLVEAGARTDFVTPVYFRTCSTVELAQLLHRDLGLNPKIQGAVNNAARRGNFDLLRFFIEHKNDVNENFDGAGTALYAACSKISRQSEKSEIYHRVIDTLLEAGAGASINEKNFVQETSIMALCQNTTSTKLYPPDRAIHRGIQSPS